MKIALVHDWLTGMRGGEKCLEAFCEIFPGADVFTLLHIPGSVSPTIEKMRIRTSALQRMPGAFKNYRYYLPLMPLFIESFDFSGYDLILSSSHAAAKAAISPPGCRHICYCFTPMRYIWDQYGDYFGPGRAGLPVRAAMAVVAPAMRLWDRKTAARVHKFIAISKNVQERIGRIYGRESEVIYPPVDTEFYNQGNAPSGSMAVPQGTAAGSDASGSSGFYLVVSALAPYKRIDIAIQALARLGRPLKIIGDGPEMGRLVRLKQKLGAGNGAGDAIEFIGRQDDAAIRDAYAGCRAVIFPGVEDFGIVPVEAQAMGKPVIGYAAGGLLETAEDGRTGVLFKTQTPQALAEAVKKFESMRFDAAVLRQNALRFNRERFKREISAQVSASRIS